MLGQSHDRSTFSIIRAIKIKKVWWVKHVAYTAKEGNTYRIVVERDQLEDLGFSRWIILKCLLQNWMAGHGLDELGSG